MIEFSSLEFGIILIAVSVTFITGFIIGHIAGQEEE